MKPYLVVKRVIDVVGSIVLVLALLPILGGIAFGILFTSGRPVFFVQPRLGRSGRVFRMWKFRTMRPDARDIRNADGTTFNGPHDSRVTPLGRLLRRTSLDELPQLVNVLKGEMSLVGARPDLPEVLDWYSAEQRRRLDLRPGITGLAQVSGRNDLSLRERWDRDTWYVDHASLWLDISIVLRTLHVVTTGTGIVASELRRDTASSSPST